MKKFLIFLFVFLAACQSEHSSEQGTAATVDSGESKDAINAVVITLDGKTHELNTIDWANSKTSVDTDEIIFALAETGNPIRVNFNLMDASILKKGSAVYVLPDVNLAGKLRVGLSFLDSARAGLAMQQRILFSEGTVEVTRLTANRLQMTFKGKGHILLEKNLFPIEGSVDIAF